VERKGCHETVTGEPLGYGRQVRDVEWSDVPQLLEMESFNYSTVGSLLYAN
jgi:hypothetical protein